MENFKFLFLEWNNVLKKVMDEEIMLDNARISYEDEIDSKELEKHLKSAGTWVAYADKNKLLYEVTALNERGEPHAWINFNEGSCYVEFLDEYNRTYMRYSFEATDSGKLFLYQMEFWRYTKGDEKARDYENYDLEGSYNFTQDGGLVVYTNTRLANGEWEEEVKESAHPINVEKNWEPYPDWKKKNYEGLVKLKRWEEGDFLKGIPNYFE